MQDKHHPKTPEDILLRQEYRHTLTRALDVLPAHERTALVVLVQHGGCYQDVAIVMGASTSTVRT